MYYKAGRSRHTPLMCQQVTSPCLNKKSLQTSPKVIVDAQAFRAEAVPVCFSSVVRCVYIGAW
eukprot:369175-Amphidinium_carterae.1